MLDNEANSVPETDVNNDDLRTIREVSPDYLYTFGALKCTIRECFFVLMKMVNAYNVDMLKAHSNNKVDVFQYH